MRRSTSSQHVRPDPRVLVTSGSPPRGSERSSITDPRGMHLFASLLPSLKVYGQFTLLLVSTRSHSRAFLLGGAAALTPCTLCLILLRQLLQERNVLVTHTR